MAVRAEVHYIAVCDVCGKDFDEDGDLWAWDNSPDLALQQIDYVADETDWTRDGQKVVCPTSDTAHYLARGAESPTLLRPGPDAMTVLVEREAS